MQVRYQTAPRSAPTLLIRDHSHGGDRRAGRQSYATSRRARAVPETSASQDLHQVFELDSHLLDDLLALGQIGARFLARELVARAADGEALVVEQAPDLADHDHVLTLVVTAVAAALHGLELREFLLPIAQHLRLHPAQLAHLSDGEVALAGNDRQLRVILWLQHRLRPVP